MFWLKPIRNHADVLLIQSIIFCTKRDVDSESRWRTTGKNRTPIEHDKKLNKIHSLNVWTISYLCATATPFYWEIIKEEHLHLKDLDLRIPSWSIDRY